MRSVPLWWAGEVITQRVSNGRRASTIRSSSVATITSRTRTALAHLVHHVLDQRLAGIGGENFGGETGGSEAGGNDDGRSSQSRTLSAGNFKL